MDKGKLTVLKADIDAQVGEIETIYTKLDDAMKLRKIYRKDISIFLENLSC